MESNPAPLPFGLSFVELLSTSTREFQSSLDVQAREQDGLPPIAIVAGCLLAGVCRAIEANNQRVAQDMLGLQRALEALVDETRRLREAARDS